MKAGTALLRYPGLSLGAGLALLLVAGCGDGANSSEVTSDDVTSSEVTSSEATSDQVTSSDVTSGDAPSDESQAGQAVQTSDAQSGASNAAATRVYAAVVSHNEQDSKESCAPVNTDEATWHANRALSVEFVERLVERGAAYDLQSDFSWIEAMWAFETNEERQATDGKNFLAWAATAFPGQVVVDAHNHDSTKNYADVAAMLADAGAPDSKVAGGFVWSPTESSDWERFRSPLTAMTSSDTWQPSVLFGAATLGHQGPDSEASGLWRPASSEAFHSHDDAGNLISIGGYKTPKFSDAQGAGLDELLDHLQAGELEAGKLYTAIVMLDQCELSATLIDDVMTYVEGHQADVEAGRLVWSTIPETVDTWLGGYAGAPTLYNLPEEASDPCGTCDAGKVCCTDCPSPGCVSDCRTTGSCLNGGTCSQQTGLCE